MTTEEPKEFNFFTMLKAPDNPTIHLTVIVKRFSDITKIGTISLHVPNGVFRQTIFSLIEGELKERYNLVLYRILDNIGNELGYKFITDGYTVLSDKRLIFDNTIQAHVL